MYNKLLKFFLKMVSIKIFVCQESNQLEETHSREEKDLDEFYEASPTVKVLNMEMTTSCEGGQKCTSRPTTPTPQR